MKNPKPSRVRDSVTRRMRRVLASGVSQSELAERAGLPQSVISMAATGYRPFNRIDVLDAVHDALSKLER